MTAITPCWPTRMTRLETWARICRPRRAAVRIRPTYSAWSAAECTGSVARSSQSSTTTALPPTAAVRCLRHRSRRLRFPSWDVTTTAAARCSRSRASRNATPSTGWVRRPPDTIITITSYCTTITTTISAVATGHLRNHRRRHRRRRPHCPATWRLTAAVAFTSRRRRPPTIWWSVPNGNRSRWTCATDAVWKSSTVTICSRWTRDGTPRVCSVPSAPGPWQPKSNVSTGTATYTARPTTKGESYISLCTRYFVHHLILCIVYEKVFAVCVDRDAGKPLLILYISSNFKIDKILL